MSTYHWGCVGADERTPVPATTTPSRWLNVAAAAERVGRRPSTIRTWMARRWLPSVSGLVREDQLLDCEARARARRNSPRGATGATTR